MFVNILARKMCKDLKTTAKVEIKTWSIKQLVAYQTKPDNFFNQQTIACWASLNNRPENIQQFIIQ